LRRCPDAIVLKVGARSVVYPSSASEQNDAGFVKSGI
jgi:hypothetical protein